MDAVNFEFFRSSKASTHLDVGHILICNQMLASSHILFVNFMDVIK